MPSVELSSLTRVDRSGALAAGWRLSAEGTGVVAMKLAMVSDYIIVKETMEQITISKFKAKCLAVLERVHQTRVPILVTKRGVPVAEIKPPPGTGAWLGSLAGAVEIVGDIVAPAEAQSEWEALR
jgi:prevent-host-death family protein